LRFGFKAGLVVDAIEEPGFPEADTPKAGVRWHDMPEIPPVMVVRMKLMPISRTVGNDSHRPRD